jgi:HD-GYP domain-containing protein (c-di-GMP phosphodiesterase class II)
MIRMGKVYQNLMVDVKASNAKLRDRAARIIATLTGLPRDGCFTILDSAGGSVKTAVVMHRLGLERAAAEHRLAGVAGKLHDVGKITVPAEILSKPGKLSALQYAIIQGHAAQGYEVLSGIDFPWPVAEVAYQHHERIDGSGYPRGLKGADIVLEARILAVADVVEAMSSDRPYRPGAGIERAVAEIELGRGTIFDPNVTDACLRLFRDKAYTIPG